MQNTPNFSELPDSIRSIMKASIEQARKAFDTFVSTSQQMTHSLDTSSNPMMGGAMKTMNDRISAFTRQNAEANFNLALRLTEARQMSEIVEMQNTHVREQMEAYSRQLEELRELTMTAVKEGSKTASAAMQAPLNSMPTNPYTS